MKNIKNSAVAEKSLAAHRLLKIKSTEDKSYQISAENCLRKRDWYGLVHFSQRKRCGNAAETRNATSFCSYVFPPSGNVTETWTIRFPQDFRNTETPYFTLCVHLLGHLLACAAGGTWVKVIQAGIWRFHFVLQLFELTKMTNRLMIIRQAGLPTLFCWK